MVHRTRVAAVVLATFATLAAADVAVAQLTWTRVATPVAPAPRFGHAIANYVLFGGRDATQAFADTWRWTGFTWFPARQAVAPSARHGHTMVGSAFGPLLFGGADLHGRANGETWRLGVTWQRLLTAHAPSPRHRHGMANDSSTGAPILFGGLTAGGANDETWRFVNGDWQQVVTTRRPPARHGHVLLPGRERGGVLLVGGTDGVTTFDDVWHFDGAVWHPVARAPFAASEALGMALDFHRRRDAFVTGRAPTQVFERTTEGAWYLQPVVGAPPARTEAAGFGQVDCLPAGVADVGYLFGGRTASGAALGDTWCLVPTNVATVAQVGSGCGPGGWGNDGPNLNVAPTVLGNVAPGWLFTATPHTLALVGVQLGAAPEPLCAVTIVPEVILFVPSDALGMAEFALPVPFAEALRGASLSLQVVVLEPSAPGGVAVSRLTRLGLGD